MKKKTFDEEIYQKAPVSLLILLSIFLVSEKNEKCVFEKLLKECFSFFPGAFSFSHISNWPDSRKLDRSLRFLRAKKLISGSPDTFFSLTKAGRQAAEQSAKIFRQEKLKI